MCPLRPLRFLGVTPLLTMRRCRLPIQCPGSERRYPATAQETSIGHNPGLQSTELSRTSMKAHLSGKTQSARGNTVRSARRAFASDERSFWIIRAADQSETEIGVDFFRRSQRRLRRSKQSVKATASRIEHSSERVKQRPIFRLCAAMTSTRRTIRAFEPAFGHKARSIRLNPLGLPEADSSPRPSEIRKMTA
jgi:hypothetical protein